MSGISKLYINQKLAIHRFENGNDDPQKRDLSDVSSPYIWVDATYVKCRDGGHVSSCALVAAIGAASDGCRRLLGLDAVDTESYAGRLAFLRSLLSSNPSRYHRSPGLVPAISKGRYRE